MRMSARRSSYSKRRTRRKTSFPIVAIVQKRSKPRQWRNTDERFSQKTTRAPRTIKKSRGTIDYKNVVLLRKLITAEGKILPRRINKLTAKQQRYTSKAIKSARILGLLPFINKSRSFNI